MHGGLAGAFYGIGGIPERWQTGLAQADLIEEFADGLFALGGALPAV